MQGGNNQQVAHVTSEVRSTYAVGDRIGPWPIFPISQKEIVAGRNNKHLDFRLSVLKCREMTPQA